MFELYLCWLTTFGNHNIYLSGWCMKYVYDIWKIYLFIFLNVDRFMWVNVLSVNTYINIYKYISEFMICSLMFVNVRAKSWAKSVTGSGTGWRVLKNLAALAVCYQLNDWRDLITHEKHMLVWSGWWQCSRGSQCVWPFLVPFHCSLWNFSFFSWRADHILFIFHIYCRGKSYNIV